MDPDQLKGATPDLTDEGTSVLLNNDFLETLPLSKHLTLRNVFFIKLDSDSVQALRFAQQSKQLFEELNSSELPRALNACAYGGLEFFAGWFFFVGERNFQTRKKTCIGCKEFQLEKTSCITGGNGGFFLPSTQEFQWQIHILGGGVSIQDGF